MRALIATLGFVLLGTPALAGTFGDCSDVVQSEWLADGRSMRLLSDYTYIDPGGKNWLAPAGAVVNGASIPSFLWSLIGGPFEGKYRDASVPHDVECLTEREEWRAVHQMFHDAMRCAEVSAPVAKIMYGAVYHCGPRWGDNQGLRLFPCHEQFAGQLVRRLRRYLSKNPETSLSQVAELDQERLASFAGESISDLVGSLPHGLEVRETLEGFIVTIAQFETGQTATPASAATFLENVAPLLNEYATRVYVEGHADAIGTNDLNMAIAHGRAAAISDELVSGGVDPEAVRTIAYGEERPISTGNTPEDHQLNRRVVIVIHEIE